ncbi:S1C family serine protease [Bythopirellula polymerisocia]|uniref:Putative periplasmic serine endoprotease DegP-like n=1 Tax=Bythopirellula polymerisocia TaxID=2528003 RepID=A0A5C6CT71_9BACT|nr:trypsin-like peptidase domain-containing protein [Bythopirellula polymerisocia]TWU28143.1 putative periplasmic serine endoprotease DegP-like precursor [Bythopirellula polymerisocia]
MYQEPSDHEIGVVSAADFAVQLPSPTKPRDLPADQLVTQKDLKRLRRLLWIFGVLLALLIAPSFVGRIQYALVEAEERAKFDVASDNIHQLDLMQLNDASRMLFDYVSPSVVHIRTHRGRDMGQGAGVIVDEAGYIVTNYHVVEGVGSLEIQLSDGRRGPASVIGSDPLVDVAVLKTELDDLHAAQWGDSDNLNVGEWVWALGSPFGFQKSITFGILSAKNRRGITTARDPGVSTDRSSIYQEFLQTDAAVNPGNSGGPLVNVEGKIIGINTAIYGSTYQGISFSIPSSIARASYEQLRKVGHVERGYLGVGPRQVPDPVARLLGLEKDQGVLVADIRADTPAQEAGIELGDVLLTWDGTEYSDPTLLSRAIAATPIGSSVPVDLVRQYRDGAQRLTVRVTVGARPQDESF